MIDHLKRNGVMEYVSIPWDNTKTGKSNYSQGLTINLSLWFIHILAGNEHEVAWEYGELRNETLVRQPCILSAEPTEVPNDVVTETEGNAVELHEKEPHFPHQGRKRKDIEQISDGTNDREDGENNYDLSFSQSTLGMAEVSLNPWSRLRKINSRPSRSSLELYLTTFAA